MAIELDERGVVGRLARVSRLLRPLRKDRSPVGCDFDSSAIGRGRILAAHDGAVPAGGNYRSWYFRTAIDSLRAQYFEVWIEKRSTFELGQAYLHLFRTGDHASSLEEIVALHADPSDADKYKMGPHIHVKKSDHPLPQCHFALDLDRLEEVTSTVESLDQALERAIGLLADEVLGAYQKNSL